MKFRSESHVIKDTIYDISYDGGTKETAMQIAAEAISGIDRILKIVDINGATKEKVYEILNNSNFYQIDK